MAAVAESHYRERGVLDRISGFTTAPHGTAETLPGEPPQVIEIFSAQHPTPDEASVAAASRALELAGQANASDLVLVLLSGGASSLWAAPVEGIDLAAKTALTRGLLKCGADIHEMNTVRRHISRIKGGRLRKATRAPMLTLAISDVPGDDPATIGSGPTVPDVTTLAEARAVLAHRRPRMEALGIFIPQAIDAALNDPLNETPKPDDPAFSTAEYRIVATPARALAAAATIARERGYEVVNLGDAITGEARDVAVAHAQSRARARRRAAGRRRSSAAGSCRSRCGTRMGEAGAPRNTPWLLRWRCREPMASARWRPIRTGSMAARGRQPIQQERLSTRTRSVRFRRLGLNSIWMTTTRRPPSRGRAALSSQAPRIRT